MIAWPVDLKRLIGLEGDSHSRARVESKVFTLLARRLKVSHERLSCPKSIPGTIDIIKRAVPPPLLPFESLPTPTAALALRYKEQNQLAASAPRTSDKDHSPSPSSWCLTFPLRDWGMAVCASAAEPGSSNVWILRGECCTTRATLRARRGDGRDSTAIVSVFRALAATEGGSAETIFAESWAGVGNDLGAGVLSQVRTGKNGMRLRGSALRLSNEAKGTGRVSSASALHNLRLSKSMRKQHSPDQDGITHATFRSRNLINPPSPEPPVDAGVQLFSHGCFASALSAPHSMPPPSRHK